MHSKVLQNCASVGASLSPSEQLALRAWPVLPHPECISPETRPISSLNLSGLDHAGVVPTKFAAALVQNKEYEQFIREATFLKRLGRPEEIAAAAAFLSSDDAAYITGETLLVAGGLQSRL